jgi:hypothetical protein
MRRAKPSTEVWQGALLFLQRAWPRRDAESWRVPMRGVLQICEDGDWSGTRSCLRNNVTKKLTKIYVLGKMLFFAITTIDLTMSGGVGTIY